jgi:hypothetical protein
MTKRSIGPAGASIVSDDGTRMKISEKDRKAVEKALRRMGDDAGTFMTTITEIVGKKGVGPAGQRVREMNKKTKGKSGPSIGPGRPSPRGKLAMVKGGGLMEATARLKAKGMKEGGMVVKEKVVAIDKSPNSGLITTKGFGAGRRT